MLLRFYNRIYVISSFLLEKWNITARNIAIKTASVLLSGVALACNQFVWDFSG